jgi:hypothetical protein
MERHTAAKYMHGRACADQSAQRWLAAPLTVTSQVSMGYRDIVVLVSRLPMACCKDVGTHQQISARPQGATALSEREARMQFARKRQG